MANTDQRKPISKRVRFNVFKRDLFTCQYCGNKPPTVILEIDHVHPVSQGGTNDSDNLITACFDCNRGKSDVLLSAIPESLAARAELMREKLDQVKAYQRLLKSIKATEDRMVDEVEAVFKLYFDGFRFAEPFRNSVKVFIQKLPVDVVTNAMHRACSRIEMRDAAVKYFCGICWRIIRESGGSR